MFVKNQVLAVGTQNHSKPALSVEVFTSSFGMDFYGKIGAFRVFSDPVIATVGPQFEVPWLERHCSW